MRTPYRDLVPSKGRPGSRNAGLRVDGPEWEGFRIAAEYKRSDRSKLILQFIDWYLYRPGIAMPERPPLAELAQLLAEEAEDAPDDSERDRQRREALQVIARELAARAKRNDTEA